MSVDCQYFMYLQVFHVDFKFYIKLKNYKIIAFGNNFIKHSLYERWIKYIYMTCLCIFRFRVERYVYTIGTYIYILCIDFISMCDIFLFSHFGAVKMFQSSTDIKLNMWDDELISNSVDRGYTILLFCFRVNYIVE